ncbi:MAG: hypothetical protein ACKVOP_09010 [Sphingomonadaceae bacterium]
MADIRIFPKGFPLAEHLGSPASKADLAIVVSQLFKLCQAQQAALDAFAAGNHELYGSLRASAAHQLDELYFLLSHESA